MQIGAIARSTGTDIETVRYYERIGLLPPAHRRPNGYRAYGASHLERLAFIRRCRALDMPLADIRMLLLFMAKPVGDCSAVNRAVDSQLARIRARLKSLRALEKELSALRAQCQGRRQCAILHQLVAASHGEAQVSSPAQHGNGLARR